MTLVLVLLAAATLLAQVVPGVEWLGRLSSGGDLDYGSHPGVVAPLTEAFVAEALGLPAPRPAAESEGEAGVGGLLPSVQGVPELALTSGPRVLAEHAPTNDAMADAYPVPAVPFSGRTDVSQAGREPDEPTDCSSGGRTVWYRYTPGETAMLDANAVGTTLSMTVGVFQGEPGALEPVGCDAPLTGAARVTFRGVEGTAYWFQVAAPSGARTVAFHLDPIGTTERVSVATDGHDDPGNSWYAAISADGRFVAFESWASTLVEGDDNGSPDVFVHDRVTGVTERVSVSSTGEQGNGNSGEFGVSISADGRYVGFSSYADNLVEGDDNEWVDAFVHDRVTGVTERVSLASDGSQGIAPSVVDDPAGQVRHSLCRQVGDRFGWVEETVVRPDEDLATHGVNCLTRTRVRLSADGRWVAFDSDLAGLDPRDRPRGDIGQERDVFVHDRLTGATTMITVSADGGVAANGPSRSPVISGDGTHVSFSSKATDLVDGDGNGNEDVFLHDLQTGETTLVSVAPDDRPPLGNSYWSDLSADGRYVAFESEEAGLPTVSTPTSDIYVRDTVSGTTELVSASSTGQAGDQNSWGPSISADGRTVVFYTVARNFGENGEQEDWAVFARDLDTRTTTLVSKSSDAEPGNGSSSHPSVSADGRHVAFVSYATNFDENDHNNILSLDGVGSLRYGQDVFVHTFGWALPPE